MTLQPGEVVLIRIDFHKAAGGKLRPAVVLLDSAMARGCLNTSSTIRVHKLTVLAKDEIVRRLGELADADRIALTEVLRRAFSLDR
jgi:mRNA-degrading endonuclease toxin of MazEF toxin-antitoxin module